MEENEEMATVLKEENEEMVTVLKEENVEIMIKVKEENQETEIKVENQGMKIEENEGRETEVKDENQERTIEENQGMKTEKEKPEVGAYEAGEPDRCPLESSEWTKPSALSDLQNIIQPYMYEPLSDPESPSTEEPEKERRILQDVSTWCLCGCCHTMPTEEENVCCKEIPKVMRRINQLPTELNCITNHPGFQVNCLNQFVLQNINNIYRADYGRVRRKSVTDRFRFLAQTSFVSWCWGFIGARLRVVIPSCAVRRICQEFPDPCETNIEFKTVGFLTLPK